MNITFVNIYHNFSSIVILKLKHKYIKHVYETKDINRGYE